LRLWIRSATKQSTASAPLTSSQSEASVCVDGVCADGVWVDGACQKIKSPTGRSKARPLSGIGWVIAVFLSFTVASFHRVAKMIRIGTVTK